MNKLWRQTDVNFLVYLVETFGCKWNYLQHEYFPNRTTASLKNKFYTAINLDGFQQTDKIHITCSDNILVDLVRQNLGIN
uniref:Myb-like DNA-binding domain-containing protein n=1 Tax=Spironucleus salmonicida TaxID=348837 RepID=V6LUB2_9EUKA|eukprot:EST47296.1 Hypothetical protein SS50377_12643 [Spironucleus salmonicida]